jgi:hypothetical protein
MQNEPNIKIYEFAITPYMEINYNKICLMKCKKNEPKTNPNEPNSKPKHLSRRSFNEAGNPILHATTRRGGFGGEILSLKG